MRFGASLLLAASNTRLIPMRTSTVVASGVTEKLPYGSWTSPITAKFITGSSVRLGSLDVDAKGQLFWLEGRPKEGGRQVVCRYDKLNAAANERGARATAAL